jgi:hypothetical protein
MGMEERRVSEEESHLFVVQVLRMILPNRFHHSPNGGWRHIHTAVKLKRMGVSAGFPDIFILGAPGYSRSLDVYPTKDADDEERKRVLIPGCVIELKAKGGKTYPAQEEWLRDFRRNGFLAKVCVGAVAALDYLADAGYLPKRKWEEIKRLNEERGKEGKGLRTKSRAGYIRLYEKMVKENV